MDKNFWMTTDPNCTTKGGTRVYNHSIIEPKRSHQWVMDNSAPEFFSNKKQATEEAVSNRSILGTPKVGVYPWHNTPNFHSASAKFDSLLFGSEVAHSIDLLDQDAASIAVGNANIRSKDLDNQNDTVMGFPVSSNVEDPLGCKDFGGIRKVRINEVRDPRNNVCASTEASYDNLISLGSLCDMNNENAMRATTSFNKGTSNNFILMGHTFGKKYSNFTSVGGNDNNNEDGRNLLIPQSFIKGDNGFKTTCPSHENRDKNAISIMASYNEGYEDLIFVDSNYEKGSKNVLMSQSCNKSPSDSNSTSFIGFHDEPDTNLSCSIIGGYDVLIPNPNPTQTVGLLKENDFVRANADNPVLGNPKALKAKPKAAPKIKEPKANENNFPANVKSLLSTGVFDGAPVKYVSWSREKSLQATIQGAAYLCGCDECKFSKAVNAYEFERHANCKTKHPNNHIYFENGKTIYAVAQELKTTSRDMLFSAIENVTGSPINQNNFRAWKVSYEAAARELERIYGKDDAAALPS